MRINQQSRQCIVRISTLITLVLFVLLGCSQHALGQWATNGNNINNTNTGNVGIGTTAPATTLDVSGTIVQRPAAAANVFSYFRTNAANTFAVTNLNSRLKHSFQFEQHF